jgi:hypothetical protein
MDLTWILLLFRERVFGVLLKKNQGYLAKPFIRFNSMIKRSFAALLLLYA